MITQTVTKTHEVRVGRAIFIVERADNTIFARATFVQSDNTDGQPKSDETEERTVEASFAEIMALPGAVAFQTAFKDFIYAKRQALIDAGQ